MVEEGGTEEGVRESQERLEGDFARRGLETFRSVRYAVSHRDGGGGGVCHDFRALIKEIRKGEINFYSPPWLTGRPAGRHRQKRETTPLYCR